MVGAVLGCNQLFVTARERNHRGARAEQLGVLHGVSAQSADALTASDAAGAEDGRGAQLLQAAVRGEPASVSGASDDVDRSPRA